ncbi:AraC family transcriptional regulator [Segetibacter sp. 3557_3]|uniref:AraC family transcriptional regulator n=1 Tax=Segetibacter sp. 3557_3 TaxID=2547429 RepID=UPI0010585B6A|nr:helix-turn-helix domain-containing protein [Segetibacter sp. 3557_3]TDH21322.1 AraC family transcriptional regulator [Segetibacter sp. 3557_3]
MKAAVYHMVMLLSGIDTAISFACLQLSLIFHQFKTYITTMKADLYAPSSALKPFIDNYMLVDINWQEMTTISPVWRLVPFGQVSMLFLFGDSHEYNMKGPDEPMLTTSQAFVVGQLTQPIWLKFKGHTRLLKVQFKPSGLKQLLPLNMHECINVASIDLGAFWGRDVHNLLEQLYESSDGEKISLLNAFFEHRLKPDNGQAPYIEYTLKQLQLNNGRVNLGKLEEKLGISNRHLERLFKNNVGLSPKEISKIIRLNYAFHCIEKDPKMSLTELAYESGYYDQAHFSKDFKTITGVSPSKLVTRKSNELFVTHGKCFVKQAPLTSTKN